MARPCDFVELCAAKIPNKISNVIGVVIDHLPQSTTSKGQQMSTFTLYDGTLQHGLKCRIFAARDSKLPCINGNGDVVILKRVKFVANMDMLVSQGYGQEIPWAVLHAPIPKDWGIKGPKFIRSRQMGDLSRDHIEYAMNVARTPDSSTYVVQTEETKAKLADSSSREKRCLIKDLQVDTFPSILGEVVKIQVGNPYSLYISDYTENNFLYYYGPKEGDEMRMVNWPGPPGQYTLWIEIWNHTTNEWILENDIKIGDIVLASNVHILLNKDDSGMMEGKIRGDQFGEDKLRLRKVKREQAAELLIRKEELGWGESFHPHEESSDEQKGKKRKSSEITRGQSKSAKKREERRKRVKREQEEKQQQAQTDQREKTMSDAEEIDPPSTPRTEFNKACVELNENVRCEKSNFPQKTITMIRDITTDLHKCKLPNGEVVRLNWAEITSQAIVRVIDFKPSALENFARAREMTDEEMKELQGLESEEQSSQASNEGVYSDGERSDNSISNKSTQFRRQKWEWNFALLLEDASSPISASKQDKDNNQILVRVQGADAEYLLGLQAVNLRTNPTTLAQLREKLFILWGDLEECKIEELRRKEARTLADTSTNTSSGSSLRSSQGWQATSRPFSCQLEEYGVDLGGQIQRRFKLKGTTIHQDTGSNNIQDDRTEKFENLDL